ncbi:MAG: hypothetical protein EOM62_09890 [Bacteroidia bacterium]|nr:hypothetical protein [Bacteroidia bacterium]
MRCTIADLLTNISFADLEYAKMKKGFSDMIKEEICIDGKEIRQDLDIPKECEESLKDILSKYFPSKNIV